MVPFPGQVQWVSAGGSGRQGSGILPLAGTALEGAMPYLASEGSGSALGTGRPAWRAHVPA